MRQAPNFFGNSGWQLPRHLENLLTDSPAPPTPQRKVKSRSDESRWDLHEAVQKLEREIKKPLPEKPKRKHQQRRPDTEAEKFTSLTAPPISLPKSPLVCEHGGEIIYDIPRCGLCLGERRGVTADESFGLFLESLRNVARRVARTSSSATSKMKYDDRYSECFSLLLNPRNLKTIASAKSPMAMATRIAKDRLNNVYRDPFYKQTTVFSQFPSMRADGEQKVNASEKVDFLCQRATTTDRRAKGSGSVAYFATPDPDDDEPGSFKLFPGFWVLWTKENVRRLVDLMKEALDKLQRKPFSHAMLIKLRHGALGDEPYTWAELAKHATDTSGKNVTVDQVRYAVAAGEASVRAHIFKKEAPEKVSPFRLAS
jgi:hypothetical protein